MAAPLFAAEESKPDPIVGKWRWFDGGVIEFRPDSRMETIQAAKKVKLSKGLGSFNRAQVLDGNTNSLGEEVISQ